MHEINGSFYDWDENKHKENIKKHGVDFYEAVTVFDDPFVVEEYDANHSLDEDRFIVIGISAKLNLLTVCQCYRDNDDVTRIISARKATKHEHDKYRGHRDERYY